MGNHPLLAGTPVAHTSPNPLDGSATPMGTPADPPTLPTGRRCLWEPGVGAADGRAAA